MDTDKLYEVIEEKALYTSNLPSMAMQSKNAKATPKNGLPQSGPITVILNIICLQQ